jgi:hypothetical protein
MSVDFKDPVVAKSIKDFCQEFSNSLLRAEAERDFQKESVALLMEKYELDKPFKKTLTKMAKVYHKSNFATTKADNEEFAVVYETLFGEQE